MLRLRQLWKVSSEVSLEVASEGESLAALVALMWLLARVEEQVVLEVSHLLNNGQHLNLAD